MKPYPVTLAILLLSCAVPPPGPESMGPSSELAGRLAGTPKRCVSIEPSGSLRIAEHDDHMLLYGSGRTIWVNDLGRECGFNSNDVLVTHPFGSSYCEGDIVHSIDRSSHIPGPTCVLSNFVPYSR